MKRPIKFLSILAVFGWAATAFAETYVGRDSKTDQLYARLSFNDSERLWHALDITAETRERDPRATKDWESSDGAVSIHCVDRGDRFESVSCRILFDEDKARDTEFERDGDFYWANLESREADLFNRVLPKRFESSDEKVSLSSRGATHHFMIEYRP